MTSRFQLSVVIPAKDAIPFVHEAVQSALQQTLVPAEVIVVDDDSNDGTGDQVEARFGDRVRVVRGRFGSAGAARNAAQVGLRRRRADKSVWIAAELFHAGFVAQD